MDDMLVANEGIKRRLPTWMLGDQARSKSETLTLNNTRDDEKECEVDEERVNKCGRRPKSKLQKKGNDNGKFKLKQSSSTPLMRYRERDQTRREVISSDAEISHDADINEEVSRKRRKLRQKTETCLETETDKDVESCLDNGETEDLTVEDLMSIAKEYVQEDNDAQVILSSKQRDKAGNRSQDVAQSGSSLNVTDTNRRFVESQRTSSSSTAENLISDTGLKPTMSGNPTQDMLDLFLGPLLKKTQEKEKENRLITERTSLAYEVKEQHSSVDLGEEPIALAKKKSSLRDKVAMFLD